MSKKNKQLSGKVFIHFFANHSSYAIVTPRHAKIHVQMEFHVHWTECAEALDKEANTNFCWEI